MRTTVTIPDELAIEVDSLVGKAGITTRNQVIVQALENWVAQKKEELIDEEFAMMAEDADYIAETLAIEAEFAQSDRMIAMLNDE
ncbi:MAG: ribbon-helix-helix domain-containing protein [Pleurocapsa sp. MO_226.B13]|nr:ribbon-helix-helix domain-containing protein [Pleurocapsa sp. MO_226.B13]